MRISLKVEGSGSGAWRFFEADADGSDFKDGFPLEVLPLWMRGSEASFWIWK